MRVEYLELGHEKEGFEVQSTMMGTIPEGLDGDTLWDLWDIGIKFGEPVSKGLGFKSFPILMELYVNHSTGGMDGFTVFRGEEGKRISTAGNIAMFTLRNGMRIVWDNRLSVNEIKEAIRKIDQEAERQGLMENGQRKLKVEN